eukprot:1157818-Pelagomonas_calceolata.AAC.1
MDYLAGRDWPHQRCEARGFIKDLDICYAPNIDDVLDWAAYKSTFLPQHASALTLEHTLSAHGGCCIAKARSSFLRGFTPTNAQIATKTHPSRALTNSYSLRSVNRIHWDETGSRLVSGSDDRKLLIWEYPDVKRLPVALTTRHRANIFGAHILPQTNGYVAGVAVAV